MHGSIVRVAVYLALGAVAVLFSSCGAAAILIGHSVERSHVEDALASDYRMSSGDAERLVRSACDSLGIAVTDRREAEGEVLLAGEDPAGLAMDVRIQELERGFVRISVQAGSTMGDIFGGGASIRAQVNLVSQIRTLAAARQASVPAAQATSTSGN